MVKGGWLSGRGGRRARATEKMVPSIEGEWARKRRMMSHAWPIVLRGGLLDPRGYPPLYALMVALAPAAAVRDAAAARGGAGPRRWRSCCAAARGCTAAAQAALLVAAAAGGRVRSRPLLLARYYVLTTASLAAGLYDYLRHGTPAGRDAPEGTL